jgi:hypothetical protein
MALNRDFYADCFARSALGRVAPAGKTPTVNAAPFAAAAKKEFDLTAFLKDLAAVRQRDAIVRSRRVVCIFWHRISPSPSSTARRR